MNDYKYVCCSFAGYDFKIQKLSAMAGVNLAHSLLSKLSSTIDFSNFDISQVGAFLREISPSEASSIFETCLSSIRSKETEEPIFLNGKFSLKYDKFNYDVPLTVAMVAKVLKVNFGDFFSEDFFKNCC